MMTRSEGLAVNEEETKDYKATSPKTEQSKTISEKTTATEKATRHSKQLGLLGDEDTASVLNVEKPSQEKPFFKSVSNNRSLAMLEGRAEGFEAEEEVPEQFSDKMRLKTEVAKEGQTERQANASVLRMSRDEGFILETEQSEHFNEEDKNVQTETAKKLPTRRVSSEQASSISRSVGYEPLQEDA